MPLDTFFNLPDDKRSRIAVAAVREFAGKGYQRTSMAAVAARAEVAKGSMYQYFKNKKDLFLYICRVSVESKLAYVDEVLKENAGIGFFGLMEKLLADGMRLTRRTPEYRGIYRDFNEGVPAEMRDEINREFEAAGQNYYRGLLTAAVGAGEVRADADLDLAAFLVYSLSKEFGEYLVGRMDQVPAEQDEKDVRDFIEILRSGIEVKKDDD